MGCGSSKPDKKPGKPQSVRSGVSSVHDAKKKSRTKRSTRSKKSVLSGRIDTGIGGGGGGADLKAEFENAVIYALNKKLEFATIADFEDLITKRSRLAVDQYNRRKIIQRVVADEFLDGSIAVRTIKRNCL